MFDSVFSMPDPGKKDINKVILDTSVLVKPSQIHPEREKYIQLLQKL